MVAALGLAATAFSVLQPFAPLAVKFIAGLLPTNVAQVLTTAIDYAKKGIAIAGPAISVLENAVLQDASGEQIKDISLAEMKSAIAGLHVSGDYEAALAAAKQ